ncbi:MAG TPA: GNAT family N-acetyltransferase [Gaiellaceae bacterium]|nr:GNAT family N-acetyltransferase [Gaiellaceae bacterium]
MIRPATPDDLPLVRELWLEFEAEVPDAPWRDSDSDDDLAALEGRVRDGIVLLAEQDGQAVGLAVAARTGARLGFLDVLYVRRAARRTGIAAELLLATAAGLRAQGAEMLELEVLAANEAARAVYERWGFAPVELTLAVPLDTLEQRVVPRAAGPTFASIHVQTDDNGAVERAVHKVLPRLGRSAGTSVTGPRNGWVAVHDELCDREPRLLQRLARELSYSLASVVLAIGVEEGAVVRYNLWDRGSSVDEYLSVPEYFGELPPGDVVALGANPTVVARLTGADPGRVREVVRTAATPSELPPAVELVEAIAAVMGVAEAGHGWVA